MRRFVYIAGLLLVLCVVAVSFLKYADLKCDENSSINCKRAEDILLINPDHPLPKNYRPENLVSLYNQKHKHFQLADTDIKIDKTVFEAMEAMFTAAQNDGLQGFIITSGYRTREEQREIFSNTTDRTAAKPGESEHETGLAFDVAVMGNKNLELTPQFKWLSQHCAEYGFILRYPKGMEDITGYPYEPWHFRYVGKENATIVMGKGITLEQYCKERQKQWENDDT
ncbi:MAG: M15 family metallopeptidase [Thermoactinomyces sp.]